MLNSFTKRESGRLRKWSGVAGAALCLATLSSANAQMVNPASVSLKPYNDPWASAKPRLWDIVDRPFTDFINNQSFAYHSGQVTVTFDTAPDTRQVSGRLVATGLKPNFFYQIKLAGKPVSGKRGWGAYGDNWSNERIGYAGRWWNDETQANATDADYERLYKNVADPAARKTVYGYLLVDAFVTDKDGNAVKNFITNNSYHVGWREGQKSFFSSSYYKYIGTYAPYSDSTYGYGKSMPSTSAIKMYLEYEPGRSQSLQWAAGDYNCRLILTEESFHNNYGGTNHPDGGMWLTVLANEDFVGGLPDTDPSNDITFSIAGPPVAPTNLSGTAVSTSQVNLTWTDADARPNGFKIERSSNNKTWALIQNFGDDVATTFTNSGLSASTTYYYRVRSYNALGDSSASNVVAVKTLAAIGGGKPRK